MAACAARLRYTVVSLLEEMVLANVELINHQVGGCIQKEPTAGDYVQYDKKKSITVVRIIQENEGKLPPFCSLHHWC